ncbi:MAG: tRNA lysidine(34) synthetase TilS [Pseudomonadota bacterium]|jgi:tRNA(Ile)-lysidine synthase|nr:tRNA lysidine(34) synthetase TilS [Alphaproteobacteria bacterium]
MISLQQKAFTAFDQLLPSPTCTLIVAVSGGADSLALTFLANEYAATKNVKLEAVTIDHALRPESSAEAEEVHSILKAHDISHHTLVWQHEDNLNRIHEQARKARYHLLTEFCKKYENPFLLTAHHAQDQIETILMRFLKGSGPAGFQGIQTTRYKNDVRIIRPLLEIFPQDLRTYLQNKKIKWIEDPSNQDDSYERTRVRQLVQHIKNLGWQEEGILTSATKIYSLYQALENLVNEHAKNFIISINPLAINQPIFFECPNHIQQEWLRQTIWAIGKATYPKPYETIDAILKILKQPKVDGYNVAGCTINVAKKAIYFLNS